MIEPCIFDNPVSCRRECWLDGNLIWTVDRNYLWITGDQTNWFMSLSGGDWVSGQMKGPEENVPLCQHVHKQARIVEAPVATAFQRKVELENE